MADELVLHVYYDEEDGFMVPISKSKPVAALRSEIEIVAQENSAENSPDQQSIKKVVFLESVHGTRLPDRYAVGQLLRDGDAVWAYSSSDKQHHRRKRKNHTLTRHNGNDRKAKRRRRPKLHQEEDSGTSDSDDQRDNKKGNTEKRSGDSVDPGSLLERTSNDAKVQRNSKTGAKGTKKRKSVQTSGGISGQENDEIPVQNFTSLVDRYCLDNSRNICPTETNTSEQREENIDSGGAVSGVRTGDKSGETGGDAIVEPSSDSETEGNFERSLTQRTHENEITSKAVTPAMENKTPESSDLANNTEASKRINTQPEDDPELGEHNNRSLTSAEVAHLSGSQGDSSTKEESSSTGSKVKGLGNEEHADSSDDGSSSTNSSSDGGRAGKKQEQKKRNTGGRTTRSKVKGLGNEQHADSSDDGSSSTNSSGDGGRAGNEQLEKKRDAGGRTIRSKVKGLDNEQHADSSDDGSSSTNSSGDGGRAGNEQLEKKRDAGGRTIRSKVKGLDNEQHADSSDDGSSSTNSSGDGGRAGNEQLEKKRDAGGKTTDSKVKGLGNEENADNSDDGSSSSTNASSDGGKKQEIKRNAGGRTTGSKVKGLGNEEHADSSDDDSSSSNSSGEGRRAAKKQEIKRDIGGKTTGSKVKGLGDEQHADNNDDDSSSSTDSSGDARIQQGIIKMNAGGKSTDCSVISSISFSDLDCQPATPRGKGTPRVRKRTILTTGGPKQNKPHQSVKQELDAVEDRVSNSESSDDDSSDSDQRQGKKGKLSPTEKPMSEKNTSPARPGVAVRALSGYHKLLEKAMEQLPHKKKAIEKSIKKVSAWLVTSRGEHATNVSEETGDNEKGIAGNDTSCKTSEKEKQHDDGDRSGGATAASPPKSVRGRPKRRCTSRYRATRSEGREQRSEEDHASEAKTKRNSAGAVDGDGDRTEGGLETGVSEDWLAPPVPPSVTRKRRGGVQKSGQPAKDADTTENEDESVPPVPSSVTRKGRGKGAQKSRQPAKDADTTGNEDESVPPVPSSVTRKGRGKGAQKSRQPAKDADTTGNEDESVPPVPSSVTRKGRGKGAQKSGQPAKDADTTGNEDGSVPPVPSSVTRNGRGKGAQKSGQPAKDADTTGHEDESVPPVPSSVTRKGRGKGAQKSRQPAKDADATENEDGSVPPVPSSLTRKGRGKGVEKSRQPAKDADTTENEDGSAPPVPSSVKRKSRDGVQNSGQPAKDTEATENEEASVPPVPSSVAKKGRGKGVEKSRQPANVAGENEEGSVPPVPSSVTRKGRGKGVQKSRQPAKDADATENEDGSVPPVPSSVTRKGRGKGVEKSRQPAKVTAENEEGSVPPVPSSVTKKGRGGVQKSGQPAKDTQATENEDGSVPPVPLSVPRKSRDGVQNSGQPAKDTEASPESDDGSVHPVPSSVMKKGRRQGVQVPGKLTSLEIPSKAGREIWAASAEQDEGHAQSPLLVGLWACSRDKKMETNKGNKNSNADKGILERSDDSLSETLEKENLCESGGEDRREEVLTSSPSKGARGKKKRTAAGTKDAADKAASNTMPTKRISQDVSPNQSPAKKRKSSENIVEGVSCENWEASMRKGVVTSIANNTLNQQTEDVVAESKNVAGRKDSGKRKRNRKGKDVNRGALSHENNEENLGAGADCPPRSRDCETGWESVAGETVANSVNGNRKKAKKKPRNWARTDTRRVSEELSVEQDAGVQDGNNMKRSNTDEVVDDQGGNPGCQTEWETVAEESADDGKKRKKEKRERKQARKRPVSDSSDRHSRDITGENSTQNVNAREEKNECNNLQKGNLDYQSQRETVFEDSDGGSKDGTADKPNKKKRRKKKKEQRAVPNEWLSDKPRTMADVSAMNGRSKVNVNWVVDQEHSIKNPGNQSSWESCVVDARGSEGGTEKRKKKPRRKTKSLEKDMSTEEGFRGDLAASERHIVKVDKRATKRIQPSAIGKTVERSNPKRRPPSSEKQQGGSVVEDSGYDGETSRENLEVKKRSVMHRGRGTDLLPAQEPMFTTASSSSEEDPRIDEIIRRMGPKSKSRDTSNKTSLLGALQSLIEEEDCAPGRTGLQTPVQDKAPRRPFAKTPAGFTNPKKKNKGGTPSTPARPSRKSSSVESTHQRALTPREMQLTSAGLNVKTLVDDELLWEQ